MTVTDQPTTTDLPCVCGCPKWDHKQGRAVCKQCTCQVYDPSPDAEVVKLRAQVEQLEQGVTVITSERDEYASDNRWLAVEVANLRRVNDELAKVRKQLVDAEAALVEANEARRMRDSDHLHQRIGAAALVISRERAGMCLRCRDLDPLDAVDHRCGPLTPVDVIIARRPNPPTTEEAS